MRIAALAPVLFLLLAACGRGEEGPTTPPPASPPAAKAPRGGPRGRVVVDHILIGVRTEKHPEWRPAPEAKVLAHRILKEVQEGADWATLKREYSDDEPPGGPYTMLKEGPVDHAHLVFLRTELAKAFGDLGYSLAVGEVGLAEYDPPASPFGYHVIKRLQ